MPRFYTPTLSDTVLAWKTDPDLELISVKYSHIPVSQYCYFNPSAVPATGPLLDRLFCEAKTAFLRAADLLRYSEIYETWGDRSFPGPGSPRRFRFLDSRLPGRSAVLKIFRESEPLQYHLKVTPFSRRPVDPDLESSKWRTTPHHLETTSYGAVYPIIATLADRACAQALCFALSRSGKW